jgi:hypothetical protein
MTHAYVSPFEPDPPDPLDAAIQTPAIQMIWIKTERAQSLQA